MLASYYRELLALHVGSVVTSLALFVLRGAWALRRPALLQRRWVRIVPHVVDTVLLGSALALTTVIHQYPFVNGWLTAKLLALVAYIVLGSVALKRARTSAGRALALAAALVIFAYIACVAVAHDPAPLHWLHHAH